MARDAVERLNRILRPYWIRIQLLVGRFVIRAVDETRKLRTLQVDGLTGETLEGVEYFQHWGFASRPHPGAEAVGVFVEGLRDHGLIIASADRRWKIVLEAGEVALFDDLGQRVKLARDGVELVTPLDVRIAAGGLVDVDADGAVTVDAVGAVTITGGAAIAVDAVGDVTVNAGGVVNLGGAGGKAVCRIGDEDEAGDAMVEGSAKVFAVD